MSQLFLLVGPGEKHELSTGKTTCVGRAPGNHILLNDALVSRRHAEFMFDADTFFVQDLNSNNGTFVNDERVASKRLKHGDRIRFGSHIYEYRVQANIDAQTDTAFDCTETISGANASAFQCPRDDFRGVLGTVKLVELCQLLQLGVRTGLLSIQDDSGKKSLLYFLKGELTGAENAQGSGDGVICSILQLTTGQFVFTNGDFTPAQLLKNKTSFYLLDAMRQQDET